MNTRGRGRRAWLPGYVALCLGAGCATSRSTPPGPARVEATTEARAAVAVDAAAPPRAPRAPVAAVQPPRDALAAEGSVVFFRVCGPCHMAMWREPPGGTLSPTGRAEAAVRRQIREGSGASGAAVMPALGLEVLPERDMPALMAYLRMLRVVAPL